MTNRHLISIFIVIALTVTSCVSKKKFLEMQDGRLKAEEQVGKLTEENNYRASRIEALVADFETMKNELMESNAIKDQYIDSLNNEVYSLQESLVQQQDSLQETSFTFGFERQRMIEDMKIKDNTISSLKASIENLENELSEQSSVIDDKNFQLGLLNDKISTLQSEKEQGEDQIDELDEKLNALQDEISALKVTLEEKEGTITRLQNNVNLLKKELGGS